jgi:hypothetical protein
MRRIHGTWLISSLVAVIASAGMTGCSQPTPTEHDSHSSFNGMLGAEGRGGSGGSDTTTVMTTGGAGDPESDGQ